MKIHFIKLYPQALKSVTKGMSKEHKALLIDTLGNVKYRSDGNVKITTALIRDLFGSNNKNNVYGFRPEMARRGVWVKRSRDLYRLNPDFLNDVETQLLPKLRAIYKSYGGIAIKINDTQGEKTSAKMIELEYQTAMDANAGKVLRERDEAMELIKAMKREMALARSEMALSRELATERHNILYSMLSPAKQEEAKNHMKLVVSDGELVK